MSVQRAIRRRRARKAGSDWPDRAPGGWELGEGYIAMHPTKGPRIVSGARLRAQATLREFWAAIHRKMRRA